MTRRPFAFGASSGRARGSRDIGAVRLARLPSWETDPLSEDASASCGVTRGAVSAFRPRGGRALAVFGTEPAVGVAGAFFRTAGAADVLLDAAGAARVVLRPLVVPRRDAADPRDAGSRGAGCAPPPGVAASSTPSRVPDEVRPRAEAGMEDGDQSDQSPGRIASTSIVTAKRPSSGRTAPLLASLPDAAAPWPVGGASARRTRSMPERTASLQEARAEAAAGERANARAA